MRYYPFHARLDRRTIEILSKIVDDEGNKCRIMKKTDKATNGSVSASATAPELAAASAAELAVTQASAQSATTSSAAVPSPVNLPVKIGTSRQLFIDEHIIEEMSGLNRVLHQPTKYAGNPIMIPLYPWEGRLELYGTVRYDPEYGFRMWYMGLGGMAIPAMGMDNSASPYKKFDFDPKNLLYSMCYATSKDGIFWERPNLRLVEYKGSLDNNVLMTDASAANVIIDPRDPDPDRLYKSLFFEARDPDGTPNMGDGVSVAFSPDGVHWTKYAGNPVITRASDSHTLLGWDTLHEKYVAYCRPSVHEGNKTRRIGRSVSDDFIHWTDPEDVLVPDNQDPPAFEFYGMPVFQYEDLYIGQLYAYYAHPEEPPIRFFGKIDVQLAVSRDGIRWERVGDRKPFIPNGPAGSIDSEEIFVANSPVLVENELWFYYTPSASEHGVTGRSGPICLAKLRLDGFVSVTAGEEIGSLVTKPFQCEGGSLQINASACGGTVEVAILNEQGVQYDGFGKNNCAVFDSDSIRHRVTWRQVSFASLKGKVIRLKFYLRNARLYSFTQAAV